MKIIYVHHALREKGNPPTQNDNIHPLGYKDAEIVAELLKMMADPFAYKRNLHICLLQVCENG